MHFTLLIPFLFNSPREENFDNSRDRCSLVLRNICRNDWPIEREEYSVLKRMELAQCYLSRKYRVSLRGAYNSGAVRKRRFPATRPGSRPAHPFLADLDLHLDLA